MQRKHYLSAALAATGVPVVAGLALAAAVVPAAATPQIVIDPTIGAIIAAGIAGVSSIVSVIIGLIMVRKQTETHDVFNSKMDRLLSLTAAASKAEGKLEGMAQEKASNADEERGAAKAEEAHEAADGKRVEGVLTVAEDESNKGVVVKPS